MAANVKRHVTIANLGRPWLYGPISREDAETILRQHGANDGLFLVRKSTKIQGAYALTCSFDGVVGHHLLTPDGRRWAVNKVPVDHCRDIDELIFFLESPQLAHPLRWRTPLTHYVACAIDDTKRIDRPLPPALIQLPPGINPKHPPLLCQGRFTVHKTERFFRVDITDKDTIENLGLKDFNETSQCFLRTSTRVISLIVQTGRVAQEFDWAIQLLKGSSFEEDYFAFAGGKRCHYSGKFRFATKLGPEIFTCVKYSLKILIKEVEEGLMQAPTEETPEEDSAGYFQFMPEETDIASVFNPVVDEEDIYLEVGPSSGKKAKAQIIPPWFREGDYDA